MSFGEGGCTRRVQAAWFYSRKALVGTGRAISIVFGIKRLGNKLSSPSIPAIVARFSVTAGWQCLGDLIASLLIGGCG